MLRTVLLCLAVGLASAMLNTGVTLDLGDVFSFGFEMNFDDGAIIKGYQWYDAINNKSRIDIGGERYAIFESNPKYDYGVITWTFPLTDTEANANINYCINRLGSPRMPVQGAYNIFPQIYGFLLVGAETIRGEVLEKWQNSVLFYYGYTEIVFYCVNRPDKDGVMQKVPIRFTGMHTDIENPHTRHMKVEIFNYDTSPIDPDVFDISKGLKCREIPIGQEGPELFYGQPQHRFPWVKTELDPFGSFQSEYNKRYGSETERNRRQQIYMKNLKRIKEHNEGNHGYKLSVNHLADRTDEELLAMLTGRIMTDAPSNASPFPYSEAEIEAMIEYLPENFDWRDYGAVMQVKNQGGCGSCWAFATVGAIEGAVFLNSNRTVRMSLSEQALVDCSWGFGNMGCLGGLPEYSFDFAKKYPIPTDVAYGGYASSMAYCHIENAKKGYSITDYVQLPSDENAFKIALLKHGPLSVAISVTWRLAYYSSGIFSDEDCESRRDALVHAVLVVGYGSLNGQKYWLIKNSWGRTFGLDGYIMIAMANNTCGVTTHGQYVTI